MKALTRWARSLRDYLLSVQARQVAAAEKSHAERMKRLVIAMAIHDGQQAAAGKVSATFLRRQTVIVGGVRFSFGLN